MAKVMIACSLACIDTLCAYCDFLSGYRDKNNIKIAVCEAFNVELITADENYIKRDGVVK